jgi:DMSO/TMAO reductase YedYZ molybdopterin-dependent catalytic subunit
VGLVTNKYTIHDSELSMEILKRNKTIILILILIAIIIAVSAGFFVQSTLKPSPTPSSSSTPTSSPSPTKNSPSPTIKPTSTPTPTSTPISNPSPVSSLFPGEITQYQGQNLTPVGGYIDYLYQHPDVAIHGAQYLDQATYKLAITGLVDYPTKYTYDEVVNNFNSTQEVATLPCVEGWSVTLLWQGVPITDILQHEGVSPNANTLIFVASDGYTTSLPLSYVKDNNITIAYKMNNVTLTPRTGWPFFLVAKNQYGYKWIEWLTEINVSNDSDYMGYWESRGYPNNGTVPRSYNTTQPLTGAPIILPVIAISVVCIIIALTVLVYQRKVLGRFFVCIHNRTRDYLHPHRWIQVLFLGPISFSEQIRKLIPTF